MISPFALVGFFLALASTHVSGFSFSKRADTSKITSPQRGDGITTGIDLDIRWESASSEDSVNIELRKGLSHNLTTVHTINSAFFSLAWTAYPVSARIFILIFPSFLIPSACTFVF